MIIRFVNNLRCRLGSWILERKLPKAYFLAQHLTPSPTALIRHRPRRPPPLLVPPRSHLIYHQATVDALSAHNSIATLAAQIPPGDEVVLLDVGGTLSPAALAPFAGHAWRTYAACATPQPEQRSYTYGLNTIVPGLKAPVFLVWRTDYVYPPDLLATYLRHLETAWFAAPYEVLVGQPETNAAFVRAHWDRITPRFDTAFWRGHARGVSLYEFQDPALFGMRRALWDRIGGLNHELWGYGWQFAEFAARVNSCCPPGRIAYFACDPPLHQTHEGTLMHQNAAHTDEAAAGIARFTRFLGGRAAYAIYRLKWHLPPKPPVP